jgi:hypothetical protein
VVGFWMIWFSSKAYLAVPVPKPRSKPRKNQTWLLASVLV